MTKVSLFILTLLLLGLIGCGNPPAPPASAQNASAPAAPAASPSASPGAMAVAPTLAMPSSPLPNGKGGNAQAKGDPKNMPPALWQQLTRAKTLEEIKQMPPETRDAILRAQGRLPASPSPSPKKK